MARVSKVAELAARKAALVAESEVYRQMLRLEFQNLRLQGMLTQRKFARFGGNPLFGLAVPLLGSMLRRRRSSKLRMVSKLLLAYKMFRRIGNFAWRYLAERARARRSQDFVQRAETESQAGNI